MSQANEHKLSNSKNDKDERLVDDELLQDFGSNEQDLVFTCAMLSSAVYQTDPNAYLAKDFTHFKHNLVQQKISLEECCDQRYMITERNDKTMFITFRGSDNWKDIMVDARILPMANQFEGVFHLGFMNRASQIPIEPLLNAVKDGYNIILTGHSLGGSIASIVATRLLFSAGRQQILREKVRCITFGCPLLADKVFAEYLQKHRMDNNFHFYVNEGDIVPDLISYVASAIHASLSNKTSTGISLVNELYQGLAESKCMDIGVKYGNSILNLYPFAKPPSGIEVLTNVLKMAANITEKILTKFVPFGIVCKLTTTLTSSKKLVHRVKRFKSPGEGKVETEDLSILKAQRHRMNNYIVELSAYLSSSSTSDNPSLGSSSIFDLPSRFNINGVNKTCKDIPKVTVLQITKSNDKQTEFFEFKITIDIKFCEFIVGLKIINLPEVKQLSPIATGEYTNKIFTFTTTKTLSNLEVQIYSHFGTTKLVVPEQEWYKTASKHTLMANKISKLSLVQLYTLSASQAFRTGKRSPFISDDDLSKFDPTLLSSVENTSSSIGQTSFNFLPDVPKDISIALENIKESSKLKNEQNRANLLKYLLKLEEIWKSEDVKSALTDINAVRALWNGNVVEPFMKQATNTEKAKQVAESLTNQQYDNAFSIETVEWSRVVHNFHNDQKISLLQSLINTFPYCHALVDKMWNVVPNVDNTLVKKVLNGAVGTVAVASLLWSGVGVSSVALTYTISAIQTWLGYSAIGLYGGGYLAFALPACFFSMVGIAVLENDALQQNYNTWLSLFLEGFGICADQVSSDTYSMEERIYNESEQKMLQSHSIETLSTEWPFKKGKISRLKEDQRFHAIKCLQSIWVNYKLRSSLSKNYSLGVIGESKAGKSCLSKKLFGLNDNSKHKSKLIAKNNTRTFEILMCNPTENFTFMDFPHMDGVSDKFKDCFHVGKHLLDAVIVVLDGSKCIDDIPKQQLEMVSFINSLDIPFIVCLNKMDCTIIDNDGTYVETTADHLNGWKKQAAQKLGINENRVKMTLVSPDSRVLPHLHHVESQITTLHNIKEWITCAIGDALVSDEKNRIIDFQPPLTPTPITNTNTPPKSVIVNSDNTNSNIDLFLPNLGSSQVHSQKAPTLQRATGEFKVGDVTLDKSGEWTVEDIKKVLTTSKKEGGVGLSEKRIANVDIEGSDFENIVDALIRFEGKDEEKIEHACKLISGNEIGVKQSIVRWVFNNLLEYK